MLRASLLAYLTATLVQVTLIQVAHAQIQEPEKIAVRLEQKVSTIRVHGMDVSIASVFASAPMSFSTVEVSRSSRQWRVLVRSRGVEQVYTVRGSVLSLRGQNLQSALRAYPNQMALVSRGLAFDVISELPFSDYLAGVLAGEMPLAWPEEALKAQAIAARSYALAAIKKNRLGFLESTVMDQVLRWPLPQADFEKAKKMILATKGIILRHSTGSIAKAFYHADCGGQTETADAVWTGKHHGRQKEIAVDSYCQLRSRKWSLSISEAEMQLRLRSVLGLFSSADLKIEFQRRGQRVASVGLVLPNKTKQISSDEFRHLLGVSELKSTIFQAERNATGWAFHGRGYGHGVGLCQWGSRELAARGFSAKQILAHYYPQFRLN